MINEGDKAPAMTVTASDGTRLNLAAPGQPLVVYFYPKDDTSGCTREAQDFTALAPEFRSAGVKVVGVSRDPMKSHEKFIGNTASRCRSCPTRTAASRMRSEPGSRSRCMVANIWGWSARPS